MKKFIFFISCALTPFLVFSDDENTGGIEEVIVTAERQASSIQDTAISITAFDSTLIEALNLRNQEDLQNYIPATTIQPYDISIRGIGRMFRALGGDPGVGTYVDGAYSVDFGIASTDNGLYDIERIEFALMQKNHLCLLFGKIGESLPSLPSDASSRGIPGNGFSKARQGRWYNGEGILNLDITCDPSGRSEAAVVLLGHRLCKVRGTH